MLTATEPVEPDRASSAVARPARAWGRPGAPRRTTPALELRQLVVLCEVARRGSFAAAADALSFTPSAVSQQVARLERDAGTQLFVRLPRGACLTEAGEALRAHAEALLARLADAEQEVRTWSEGRAGTLRVGSFPTGTATFGAAALERFRAGRPAIALRLVDGEPYESARRLRDHELDLAVLFDFDDWPASIDYDGEPVCAPDALAYVALFDDPFLLVVPRSHRLARSTTVTLADLHGERMLGGPSQCAPWGRDLRRACRAAGSEPELEDCYQTIDVQAIQALVATGRGLSLLPRLALTALRGDLCARALEAAPVRHVRVARRADAPASPACLAMLDALRATTAHLGRGPAATLDRAA